MFFLGPCTWIKNLKLYGPFLWMGFNYLKSSEALWGGSLLFTTNWAIPERIQIRGFKHQSCEGMEFPRVLRKILWKFQMSIKKEVEFPGVIKKKNVEFPWVLVFGLEISKSRGVIQFWGISITDEALFSPEFLKVKWQI